MKLPLPDNGIEVKQGDTHFIYKGVYHPIIWRGDRPYRPRAEVLVIKDNNKVFLKLKDSSLPEYGYAIPGGSLDTDATEQQQAENEVNEEALIDIEGIYNTGLYYIRDFQEGFLLKGGDICLQYAGQISALYIANYKGPFDKSKIDKHDLDPDMAKNGKFHEIRNIAPILSDIHVEALINSNYIDDDSKRYLRDRNNISLENSNIDDVYYTRESLISLIDVNTLDIISESTLQVSSQDIENIQEPFKPEEREIPRFLYHGTDQNFPKLKALSIDFGNELQEPGWSLFLWGDYETTKSWAIMRYLQRLSSKVKCKLINAAWDRFNDCAFMSVLGVDKLNSFIKKGDMIYIYTVDSRGYDIGLGNDITLDEYTIRDKDIKLYEKESIPVTLDLIKYYVKMVDDFDQYSQEIEEGLINRGDDSFLIVNNYKDNLDNMSILNKGLEKGEIKPGDDIELYLKSKGRSIHRMSTTDRISVGLSNGLTKSMISEGVSKNDFAINPNASEPKIKSVRRYRFKDGSWNSVKRKDGSMKSNNTKDSTPDVQPKVGDGGVNIMAGPSMARKPLSGDKEYGETKVEAKLKGKIDDDSNPTTSIKEAALTAKEKNMLDDNMFGLPEQRKYPLHDKQHVLLAIKFFNYADKSDKKILANNIRDKVREYGMTNIKLGSNNKLGDYLDLNNDDTETFIQEQTLYGIPSEKKIHLKTEADVKLAVAYFNKISVGHEKELAINIGKRVRELGIQINLNDSNKLRKYYDPTESEDSEHFTEGKTSDEFNAYLNSNIDKDSNVSNINNDIDEITSNDEPTLSEINTIFKSLSKQERLIFSDTDIYDDTDKLVYRRIYKINDQPIGFIDLIDLGTKYNDLIVLMAIVPKYRNHKISSLMISEMLVDMKQNKNNYNINIHTDDIDSKMIMCHLVDKFGFDNINVNISSNLKYIQSGCNKIFESDINAFLSYYPILEAEEDQDDEEPEANDYTDDETDDEEPEANDYTDDESATDDTTDEEPEANDYTDDESATDDTEDNVEDAPTTDTDNTEDNVEDAQNTEDDNSSENINIKNYNLLLSFNKLITMVSNTVNKLETTTYVSPLKNSVIVQIIDNLYKIKDFLFEYVTIHFDSKDYRTNLKTYYTIIQSIKLNYKMLESSQYLDASNNNSIVKK